MRFENLAAGVVVGGKYRLEEILGRGSYGDVKNFMATYSDIFSSETTFAFHTNQDRALKVYLDKADRIRALNHPRIVKIFEAGRLDGLAMISVEYVSGQLHPSEGRRTPQPAHPVHPRLHPKISRTVS